MVEDILLLGPEKQCFRGGFNRQISQRVTLERWCPMHTKIYVGHIHSHEQFASCTPRPQCPPLPYSADTHGGAYLNSSAGWGTPGGCAHALKQTNTNHHTVSGIHRNPSAHVQRFHIRQGADFHSGSVGGGGEEAEQQDSMV